MTFIKGGPCFRIHKVWTPELDNRLLDMIGTNSYSSIAKACGRSVDAVRKRAARLGYKIDRGTVTLRELARQTGYDRHQFRRARLALQQTWKRANGNKLLIRQDQADELIDFLYQESQSPCPPSRPA